ncbi:MAG: DUF72 domain-containing protein [Deltaproteobacteria bacterium]|uniref:DUF72 domain-containing protein n=1 Tax=Candidatus Zymogenus saltonus TaxID=2844893 RepID=A0A9D8PIL7_9DELT|nr:DUF72 domain-containing protein [Candidatus Zymogenus saltonus]
MDIRIGTSGFSFDDWVGPVYPVGLNKREWLRFYEEELGLKAVEINYTYYAMPSAKTLSSMSDKTSGDFSFVVKAHRSMTHDLWGDKKREEMAENSGAFERFNASLFPLIDEGKLTCVLAQFPYSFHNRGENLDYLKRFRERMGDIPTVIEFRNRNWHGEEAIDFLRRNGLGYCVVDEPKIRGLMPFNPVATTDLAYVRLHGRNKNWYNAPLEVRYDYLYSKDELAELLEDIVNLAMKATTTMVFFNNCHAGSAAKNAIELAKTLLNGE